MGLLGKIIVGALVGAGALLAFKGSAEEKEKAEEEQKRKNTPCEFDDCITEADFNSYVQVACKSIKRIANYSVEGPIIYATVRSQSGISDWNFSIDFNDYGKITWKYWIYNENSDSNIPSIIAERIKENIIAKKKLFDKE